MQFCCSVTGCIALATLFLRRFFSLRLRNIKSDGPLSRHSVDPYAIHSIGALSVLRQWAASTLPPALCLLWALRASLQAGTLPREGIPGCCAQPAERWISSIHFWRPRSSVCWLARIVSRVRHFEDILGSLTCKLTDLYQLYHKKKNVLLSVTLCRLLHPGINLIWGLFPDVWMTHFIQNIW